MKTEFPIRCVASLLFLVVSVTMQAGAQDTIPFKTMMQSTGADPTTPPKQDAKDGYGPSSVSKGANHGKAERIAGGVLLGTGVAVISTTTFFYAAGGSGGHPGRIWAGIGGGTGIAGAGITLIVVGNHKRASN